MRQFKNKQLSIFVFMMVSSVTAAQDHAEHQHNSGVTQSNTDITLENIEVSAQEHNHSQHNSESSGQAENSDYSQHDDHVMPIGNNQGDTQDAMNHEMMDHSPLQLSELETLRDPHAYSNGYELTSGPYVLPTESMIGLADETIFTGLWVDRFEYVESHDADATEFEGHAWLGDSYNRWLLRSEIEVINDNLETAEVDLMHSRAISPFWDLRFGVRREFGEEDNRNWASIGLGGLAPYWFEVDASLFLGEGGNSLLDIEAEYDLLLTQRLVFQPRIDIHSYGKTDREMGYGSGLSTVKAGFRLRYEFDRQLAPYFGIERVLKFGKTADLLELNEDRNDTHWVVGFKFWF